jgi:hypothetical protein
VLKLANLVVGLARSLARPAPWLRCRYSLATNKLSTVVSLQFQDSAESRVNIAAVLATRYSLRNRFCSSGVTKTSREMDKKISQFISVFSFRDVGERAALISR